MTEFRPECTINLHVESVGKAAKLVWACTLVHQKRGCVVAARKFLGNVSRDEAELRALLFGLRQARRFLQEKVEVAASFSLAVLEGEGRSVRGQSHELKAMREAIQREWQEFRLRKAGRLPPAEQAILRESVQNSVRRKSAEN